MVRASLSLFWRFDVFVDEDWVFVVEGKGARKRVFSVKGFGFFVLCFGGWWWGSWGGSKAEDLKNVGCGMWRETKQSFPWITNKRNRYFLCEAGFWSRTEHVNHR